MVLRNALAQTRGETVVGKLMADYVSGAPISAGNLRILTGSVAAYLWHKSTRNDRARAETTIINCLRADGHVPVDHTAYIEEGCIEHDVVHVNVWPETPTISDRGQWLEIDRAGNIKKL